MDPTDEEKAKAERAVRLLYILIGVGILLPLFLFFVYR